VTAEQRSAVRHGATGGAVKSAVGAFVVAVLCEVGIIPADDVGPNTLILLTWAAGQIVYTALSPKQWAGLLGK